MKARIQNTNISNEINLTSDATPKTFKYELSIGIIVKNELKFLMRCVDSLQQLREAINCQLIITDTGSTDGTKEYAQKVADTFLEFEWCDDFAAARNTGVEAAEGRWFLQLDADEFLDSDCEDLINFFNSAERSKYGNIIIQFHDYYSTDFAKYNIYKFPRFTNFSNKKFFFVDKIHEHLPVKYINAYSSTTILHHTGYLGAKLQKKLDRNEIPLLEKIKADPLHIRSYLHLAAGKSRLDEKIEVLEDCYKKVINTELSSSADFLVIIASLAKLYCNAQLYKKLDDFFIEYIKNQTESNTPYLEILYYLGFSKFKRGEFLPAINYLTQYQKMYEYLQINTDVIFADSIFLSADNKDLYNSSFFVISNAYELLLDFENAYKVVNKYYSLEHTSEEENSILPKYLETLFRLDRFNNIREIYDLHFNDTEKRSTIIKLLKNLIKPNLYSTSSIKLNQVMSTNITDAYIALNALRFADYDLTKFDSSIIDIVKSDEIAYQSSAFSDYLYCLLINKRDDFDFIENCTIETLLENIKAVYVAYAEHPIFIKEYIESLDLSAITDIKMLNFVKNLAYALLANLKNVHRAIKITPEYVNFMLDVYAELSYKIACNVYDLVKISDNLSSLPGEYSAAITLHEANKLKNTSKLEYIKQLKQALKYNPKLFKAVEMVIADIQKQVEQTNAETDEFFMLAKTIKSQIKMLISAKDFTTAKTLLDEYSKINPNDSDIAELYKTITT